MSDGARLVEIVANTMAVLFIDSIPNPVAEWNKDGYSPKEGELEKARIELGLSQDTVIDDLDELDGLYSTAVNDYILDLQGYILREGIELAEKMLDSSNDSLDNLGGLSDNQIIAASLDMFKEMREECAITHELFALGFSKQIIKVRDAGKE